jgi:hypothetical protein
MLLALLLLNAQKAGWLKKDLPTNYRGLRENDKRYFHFAPIDMISGEIDGNWFTGSI